jgi:hypothetical protein
MQIVPGLVPAARGKFAMRYIMTQAAAFYVISTTVRVGVPAYLEGHLHASIPEDYVCLIRIRHFWRY